MARIKLHGLESRCNSLYSERLNIKAAMDSVPRLMGKITQVLNVYYARKKRCMYIIPTVPYKDKICAATLGF